MSSASELWGPTGRCDGRGHGGSVATADNAELGSLFWCLECDMIPVDGWPNRQPRPRPAQQPPADA